jgi:hypothetical protein
MGRGVRSLVYVRNCKGAGGRKGRYIKTSNIIVITAIAV